MRHKWNYDEKLRDVTVVQFPGVDHLRMEARCENCQMMYGFAAPPGCTRKGIPYWAAADGTVRRSWDTPPCVKPKASKPRVENCPFCGGPPEVHEGVGVVIRCAACGVGRYADSYPDALQKWNTRAGGR